jgi:nickel/cobalt exporter
VGDIFELQRQLYTGALDALDGLGAGGISAAPGLIAAALAFGMLHALLPGHGKAVLASWYAADGQWRGAIGSSALLILTHVGSAIVLVLSGFVLLQRTIGGGGRAPAVETTSAILVLLVGGWLLWRALRSGQHNHGRGGPVLAFVTGLVPCPLTTFIMTYAASKELIGSGLLLSGAFATGMIATVAAFPVTAVLLRKRLLGLLTRTETLRSRIARALEIAAAIAVITVGLWALVNR